MRSRRRNISVFSISALDLFAAALGAFILIVLVLLLEDLVEKRRFAAESTQTDMSIIRALRADIRLLDKKYKSTEENMSAVEARLQEVLRQTSEVQIPDPPPEPKPIPDPIPDPVPVPEPPRNVGTGQEFSILGVATQKKDFVILVDMSGSMRTHTKKVSNALKEIVSQMDDSNRFVIIGYIITVILWGACDEASSRQRY